MLEKPYLGFEKRLSRMPNTFISSKKAEHIGSAVHEFFESLTKI